MDTEVAPQLELQVPAETADPEVPQTDQTEEPATEPVVELAADAEREAAAPEVEPEPGPEAEKPLTRAELDEIRREEREAARAEAQQEAAQAAERERKRRQSENARREADAKRTAEERAELSDTVVATLGKAGYHDVDPDMVSTVIDRAFTKKEGYVAGRTLTAVDEALDFYTGKVEMDDLSAPAADAARRIAPRLQSWINATAEQMSDAAMKQGVPNLSAKELAEMASPAALKELVDSQIAARNAQQRSTQTEVKRPAGAPATANTNSIEYWEQRVAHEGEDGFPDMSDADWGTYKSLRRQHGYN